MTNVIATLQVEGFHCWPNAPEHVAFLRDRHRHIFHVVCKKSVSHGDREVEIITLKNQVSAYLSTYRDEFGTMSCEMIAQELVERFSLTYCSVMEDGENGAEVYA